MFEIKNKKNLTLAITVYFSLILAVIIIGQHEKFLSIINSVFTVLSPLIIGFALAYLLNPILVFLEKNVFKFIKNKKGRRCVGVLFTYVSLVLFFLLIGFIVLPQVMKSISDLVGSFEVYKLEFIDTVNAILQKLKDREILPKSVDATVILNMINDRFTSGSSLLNQLLRFLAENIQKFIIIPKNILLGLFVSIYALFAKERLRAQISKCARGILSDENYERLHHRFHFTHKTFGGYFTGVLIDAIFVGVVSFIALSIFKVPYASLVSVIVAVTNVIPIFGPFIGSIPSAIIIFISDPQKVIPFILLILIIQQIDGNIIAPKILGSSTGMSSLSVIVAITIMGSSFGFMGMLIGVPVFAVIIGIIKELVEERLTLKELPVETSCYYPKDSIFSNSPKHVTVFDRIKNLFTRSFKNNKK